MPGLNIDFVYLSIPALVKAFSKGQLTWERSLAIINIGPSFISDDFRRTIMRLPISEEEKAVLDLGNVLLRQAHEAADGHRRVAWIEDWEDRNESRKSVSYILSEWRLTPPAISRWNTLYSLGFEDAVREVVSRPHPSIIIR